MDNNNGWTEVGGENSEMWNGEGSVIGTLIGRQSNVGPNNSMKYNLQQESGEVIGVWGSTVLDTKLEQVANGTEVKITFLGKRDSKGGRGQYKDFKVEMKPVEGSVSPAQVTNVQDTLGGEVI